MLLLSVVVLFPSLGKVPLWIYDEVRNAECAREMWERGDAIVPTFNGELRTLKPVLHYYFMWGGFELFGQNEWGARFFSAVFGVLTILITYLYIARFSSKLHGFISACILLVSTHFLFEFRMSVPDPYLIFLNTLSIFATYQYFVQRRLVALLIASVAFGLGILAKGPVALALPGLALLCWIIWEKKWKLLFHWHLLLAAVIILAVALPWYLAVHQATDGAWTRGFFLEHNIGRFSEPMEGHGGLFLIVPAFVLFGMLPAAVFIGESVRDFRNRYRHSLLRLGFCVMVSFIAFYAVSGTKLPNYPMPCYPFVALVLGHYISLAWEGRTKARKYPWIVLLVINILLPVGLYFGIRNEVELKGEEPWALPMLILTATALFSFLLLRRKGFRPAALALLAGYTLFNIVFFNLLYPALYGNNPLSKTLPQVRTFQKVVAYKIFQPSFTFYLPERVRVFDQADSLAAYLQQHEALVLTRQALAPELDSLKLRTVAAHHDLFETHTTILLTNRERLP
ncbi:MAG TPA: glycosyltransferase family 39 protein [Chitinophagaceae bacterium]|nr:glycosyltransferase family 39 protein [Chitinophagaceae bacterium]